MSAYLITNHFFKMATRVSLAATMLLLAACGGGGGGGGGLATPNLADVNDVQFDVGVMASFALTNNGGDRLTRCDANPPLPAGLTLVRTDGRGSCMITGAPSAASALTTYTLTATNATGSNTATVSIIVWGGSIISLPGATIAFISNVTPDMISVTVPSNTNGTAYVAVLADGAPAPTAATIRSARTRTAGVDVAGKSRVIADSRAIIVLTGLAPNTLYDVYTVVESDDGNFHPVMKLDVTTPPRIPGTPTTPPTPPPTQPPATVVPSLANAVAAPLTENSTAGLPIRFTNTGGGALTSCTVSNPALPAGLMARPTTDRMHCEIIGTPTAMTARATYTMTARNAAGTGTATVSITIDAAPPPATAKPILANVTTPQNLTLGTPAPTITFTNTGGGSLTSCTVSNPALPAGLTARPATGLMHCEIIGTPTVAATQATYTMTARNAAGSDTATVSITITATPPALARPSLANAAAASLTKTARRVCPSASPTPAAAP